MTREELLSLRDYILGDYIDECTDEKVKLWLKTLALLNQMIDSASS